MNQSIIRVTPDQLGYKDRGIVKWFGMILSDHSEALKKEKVNDQLIEVKAKEEMTEEQVATILYKAFMTNSPVLIQANVMRNGNYYSDLACKVNGQMENQVYLITKSEYSTKCTIDQIRNVEFMNVLDWYNKRR